MQPFGERLPAELCTMVMMSDDAHAPLLESVKARASTIPNLRLHENVRWENMGEYFAKAKLFVNTSTHEGFPNTFVEAAIPPWFRGRSANRDIPRGARQPAWHLVEVVCGSDP